MISRISINRSHVRFLSTNQPWLEYSRAIKKSRKEFMKDLPKREPKPVVTMPEHVPQSRRHLTAEQIKKLLAEPEIEVVKTRRVMKMKKEKKLEPVRPIPLMANLLESTTLKIDPKWIITEEELDAAIEERFEFAVPVTEPFKESLPKRRSDLAMEQFLNSDDPRYYNDPKSKQEAYTMFVCYEDEDEKAAPN